MSAERLLTTDDLRKYIVAAGENGMVDAKGRMKWYGAEVKASLASDIAAFANSEGGGAIVIGKEQLEDGTFNIVDLSAEEAVSFDTACVAEWINHRFAPPISFTCYPTTHDGKRVVVIIVDEFTETPVICVKECHIEGKGDVIRRGSIYVRTNSGSSTPLQTRDQLATLVARAVVKQQDRLREIFDHVLSGRTATNRPTDEEEFAALAQTVEEQLQEDIEGKSSKGAWQFTVHGETFGQKWDSASELTAVVERHRVSLWRGFPQRSIRPQPTDWGIAGSASRSAWGLTFEGLFVYWEDFTENHEVYRDRWVTLGEGAPPQQLEAGKWIDYVRSIYTVAMFFHFVSKYAPGPSPLVLATKPA